MFPPLDALYGIDEMHFPLLLLFRRYKTKYGFLVNIKVKP